MVKGTGRTTDVFSIHAANTDVAAGTVNPEGYKDVAKQLASGDEVLKLAGGNASGRVQR